jgi:hypothetical protein
MARIPDSVTSVGRVMVPAGGQSVFAASVWNRVAALGARVCVVGLAAAAILGFGARHGVSGGVVAAAVLVGPLLWVAARPGWRAAWRVVASEQYVEGTRYGGRRVRLTWDHVGEVQRFVRRGSRGWIRVLSLSSIDRQREIIFDDRLPGFEQLVAVVETRTGRVSDGAPSSWRRARGPEPAAQDPQPGRGSEIAPARSAA